MGWLLGEESTGTPSTTKTHRDQIIRRLIDGNRDNKTEYSQQEWDEKVHQETVNVTLSEQAELCSSKLQALAATEDEFEENTRDALNLERIYSISNSSVTFTEKVLKFSKNLCKRLRAVDAEKNRVQNLVQNLFDESSEEKQSLLDIALTKLNSSQSDTSVDERFYHNDTIVDAAGDNTDEKLFTLANATVVCGICYSSCHCGSGGHQCSCGDSVASAAASSSTAAPAPAVREQRLIRRFSRETESGRVRRNSMPDCGMYASEVDEVVHAIEQLSLKFEEAHSLVRAAYGSRRSAQISQTLGVQLKLSLKMPIVLFGHPGGEGFELDLGRIEVHSTGVTVCAGSDHVVFLGTLPTSRRRVWKRS